MKRWLCGAVVAGLTASVPMGWAAAGGDAKSAKVPAVTQPDTVLLGVMQEELARAMKNLGNTPAATKAGVPTGAAAKPYFLSYAVSDTENVTISAQFGALSNENESRRRSADVQVRLGSEAEDNTHGTHRNSALTSMQLPVTDDKEAIARSLWFATNRGYGRALDSFLQVKTEQQVRAKEEDSSADFSREQPVQELVPVETKFLVSAPILADKAEWEGRLRELSGLFKQFPDVFYGTVNLDASNETDYFVSSDGTKVSTPSHVARLVIVGRTRAADGMDLYRVETFESDQLGRLPEQKVLVEKTLAMAKNLEALRVAPVTEPFNGPAILSGRASAVFFHEVLGHRLEGQRQKGDEEGQTFTKLLGKQILPPFMSVTDDPTIKNFDGVALSGHYVYDDEGQKARPVQLIKDGVLETFLMSRLPIASFGESNGHGRAEAGHMPTGRQGNLIVTSSKDGERDGAARVVEGGGEEAGQSVWALL